MDQNDLKEIGKLIKAEFEKNNKSMVDLMDEKFEKNNKSMVDLMDKKFEKNNKSMVDLMDEKFEKNNKSIGAIIQANNEALLELVDNKLSAHDNNLDQKLLSWKSEIVNSVDSMAKEIGDEREFRSIASHQIHQNTRRIEKLEKKVFGKSEI